MKNYEKYADEIRKYKGDSFCNDFIEPYILKPLGLSCTISSCTKCKMLQMVWLLEEYEEHGVDWSKVEVDTPILVRDGKDCKWIRRYFAKYEDGDVYAWSSGCTSWSKTNTRFWKYAKLAESEEE